MSDGVHMVADGDYSVRIEPNPMFDYDKSEANFEAWAHERGYSPIKDEAGVTTYQKVIEDE